MTNLYIAVGGAIDTTPEKAEEIARAVATILICDGLTSVKASIYPLKGAQGASE